MAKKIFVFGSRLFLIAALLLSANVFSQNLNVSALSNRFNDYSKKYLQEKLYLHTDKDFYVAGEIIWFKVYYVDGIIHKPANLSKVAYVEVLSNSNQPVLQAKISLQPGAGKGSFYLPLTLGTGFYTVKAYTNWMKNFDSSYFFEKRITVVNTVKSNETAELRDSNTVSVNFFPEGGNLVSGIQSKVGFIAADRLGKGIDFLGFVVNENQDTVASFKPFKFGIGNFNFRPLAGHTYRAIISLTDGKSIVRPLPKQYDNGMVMSVSEIDANSFRVSVVRRKNDDQAGSEKVILAAHTRQVLDLVEEGTIGNSDSTSFLVGKSKLGKGITHFTLFNEKGQPICERLVYLKPPATLNVQVKSDKTTYGTREPVELAITPSQDKDGLHLSAAVYSVDTLSDVPQENIASYMWLRSDLAGRIESPAYYFTNNLGVEVATDNLMLTHGWRRFNWDNVLNEKSAVIKYLPELNGQLIAGRLVNTKAPSTVANAPAILTVPGHPYGFYVTRADSTGGVLFEVKDYFGDGEIIAQPASTIDTISTVEIQSPFVSWTRQRENVQLLFSQNASKELQNSSIGMQVNNLYSGDSLKNFYPNLRSDSLPLFGKPEFTYLLDDYRRFTTIEEVLREYVSQISVGLKGSKLVFKMFNPAANAYYTENALVLVDGVPLTSVNKIFQFDPMKIKRLDIYLNDYVAGPLTFKGVASFVTYNEVFNGFDIDPRIVAIDYNGLQLQREFYAPEYVTPEQKNKRVPDFRNTLAWFPDIEIADKASQPLKFYTSDATGKYLVVLQGLNDKGEFVSTTSSFEVK